MTITVNQLHAAARRSYATSVLKTVNEARARGKKTAFLCHSHKDQEMAKGLQILLAENGLDLYIDWQDNEMPETPNKETAEKIKKRIVDMDLFLFLATSNSTRSRWCPWEIGFADSEKRYEQIIVIPTVDNSGQWYGNEYLQLYQKITDVSGGGLAVFSAGKDTGGSYVRNFR